jgi:hypothetical protein
VTDEALLVLQGLARKGELTPERVVELARSRSSPLHEMFEWDDEVAAHAHRLQQARAIIRSVRVEVTVDERVLSVPKYVHDPERDETGGYVETMAVASKRSVAARVLRQEFARAVACLRRAQNVAAAMGMSDRVDELIRELSGAVQEVDDNDF